MYNILLVSSSKFKDDFYSTKKLSYSQFCSSGRKANIKAYILKLLESYPNGLTCREISDIGDIWVQSLTNPLKSLQDDNLISVSGYKKSSVSNRVVQIYSLHKSKVSHV